jgi:hypothetical protein
MNITVQHADMASNTPAKCNHRTGVIYVNTNTFYKYPKPHQDFILLHELGHLKHKTHSEFTADQYAYYAFKKLGYTDQQALQAIKDTLPNPNPEQSQRIQAIFNKTLKPKFTPMRTENIFDITYPSPSNTQAQCPECDSFLGMGKKAQERKRLRNDSKNKAREIAAEAKLELAKKGIDPDKGKRDNIMKMIGGIGGTLTSVVGGLTGGGAAAAGAAGAIANLMTVKDEQGNDVPNPNYNPNLPLGAPLLPKPWYKTTGAIIGMAVGAVVVIGAIIYFLRKK